MEKTADFVVGVTLKKVLESEKISKIQQTIPISIEFQ